MTDTSDRLLQLLRNTILSEVRLDQSDLSMRQLAMLLTVYRTDELQTVRGLAKGLNASRPAVTCGLDRLEDFDLARRKIDVLDRRSVLVMRTNRGEAMMQRLEETMAMASGST